MKSRSPQFLWSGGSSELTWGKVTPWSKEAATTGYQSVPLASMKAAYTVPSGATATAGSQELTFEPTEPGKEIGAWKLRPPSTERPKPIPLQPIQVS